MPDNKQPEWMSHLIGKTVDLNDYVRVLVQGDFGSGKTHFAATYPKPWFIDLDDGMNTTKSEMNPKGMEGVRFVQGDAIYEPIMDLLVDLYEGHDALKSYKTLVLDGYTELANLLMYEIMGGPIDPSKGRKPEYDQWGTLRGRMRDITNAMKKVPLHVVATVLTNLEYDKQRETFVGEIALQGGFRKEIGGKFDEVYYLEKRRAKTNEPDIGGFAVDVFTQYHPRFACKSRLRQVGKIPSKVTNPTFKTLYGDYATTLQKIKGGSK
jgi:hypothetical protein